MCSIAAGLRSRSSTVACIASATDAKKTRPKPFARGSGEIFSSAEKIAASVPSLPAKISLKSFGAVARPALQQTRRHPLRHFRGMFSNYFENLLPLSFERRHATVGEADSFLYRCSGAYGYNSSIGHHDFERKDMIGGRAVNRHVRAG